MVVLQRVLKAVHAHNVGRRNTGGSQGWSIARILGKASAKAETSNFIFYLKAKNGQSANNAGVA
jgi:hypothetical protein